MDLQTWTSIFYDTFHMDVHDSRLMIDTRFQEKNEDSDMAFVMKMDKFQMFSHDDHENHVK